MPMGLLDSIRRPYTVKGFCNQYAYWCKKNLEKIKQGCDFGFLD